MRYFFDCAVNQISYRTMLRYWFIPHLQDLRLLDRVWFQLDVASAHYAVAVSQKHNEVLLIGGLDVVLAICCDFGLTPQKS